MKKDPENDFEKFEALARSVVNVPHSVVKEKLDEGKRKELKRRKSKRRTSSHAVGALT